MMGATHSSLKTASLDLDLSSTGMSTMLTGREENIHMMDMPDDDDDDDEEVKYANNNVIYI